MKRSRPPTSSSGALNYGSDDGQRSRIEEERDSNPAKRPKTNNGPHGTVLMHPHDIRPSKSLVTKYNTPGSESAQMNDKERSVEIQKLKEKLSILEGSSDRECQGTSYSPVRPNLNDSKLGSYSDTQKLEDQHGMHPDRDEQLVRPPSRHRSSSIDRGGWNENRPNHTSSYDRDHRDDTHRDTQRPVTSQSGIQRGDVTKIPLRDHSEAPPVVDTTPIAPTIHSKSHKTEPLKMKRSRRRLTLPWVQQRTRKPPST